MTKRKSELFPTEELRTSKRQNVLDFSFIGSDLTVLARFVDLLNEKDVDELVKAVVSDGNVLDILNYLNTGTGRKPSELLVIIKAIYVIIIKTSRELKSLFPSVARSLAEGVLEDVRLATCLGCLSRNPGAELSKAVFQLLASVVTVGADLARGLLRSINFENNALVQCSRRRNTADSCDVRTCFINFVCSFVFLDNNVVMRELVDKRGSLILLVKESLCDKYVNVMLILTVLRKIVENKTISKTQKVRLFNRICLQQLGYLYLWRGEGLKLEDVLSRHDYDIDEDQVKSVRESVHKLLLLLTTSHRHGLVFTSRRRTNDNINNDLILFYLTCPPMESAYSDPLRTDLVVQSLCTCVDIFSLYLDHLASSLYPRNSPNWFTAMNFVFHIYHSIQTKIVKHIKFMISQSFNMEHVAKLIVDMCFLSPKMIEPLSQALKFDGSSEVITEAKKLIKFLIKQLKIPLTWISVTELPENSCFTPERLKTEVYQLVRERLPSNYGLKKLNNLYKRNLTDKTVLANQELESVPVTSQLDESDAIEEKSVTEQLENKIKQLNQLFNNLPKDIRKKLKPFNQLQNETDCEPSTKLFKSLDCLKQLTIQCFETYSNNPVIYHYLSNAIRLIYTVKGISNPPKPKFFWKILINYVTNLRTLLIERLEINDVYHHSSYDLSGVKLLSDHTNNKSEDLLTQTDSTRYQPLFKECFLKFLLELAIVAPKVLVKHLPSLWLLASYTATLSSTDQIILRIIFEMEKYSPGLLNQYNISIQSFIVWGPVSFKHYQFDTNSNSINLLQPTIFYEPNLNSLFTMLDGSTVLYSALNFPMNRKWLGYSVSGFDLSLNDVDSAILDPCFVLHAFCDYLFKYRASLDSTNQLNSYQFLKKFYSEHCLSYTVAALSSYSKHIRTVARSIIAVYRELLDQSTSVKSEHSKKKSNQMEHFPESLQIIFLLDILRNSLSSGGGVALRGESRKQWMFISKADTGARLTKIHANFFIRSLQLLSKPENHMYQPMWNCLLAKPAIDLSRVPDFMRLFFCADTQFRVERSWIIRLCVESLGDPADYLVMEHSRIFKYVFATYSCPSSDNNYQVRFVTSIACNVKAIIDHFGCDHQTVPNTYLIEIFRFKKLLILQLIHAATKHPRLTHTLIRFHALPLWLSRHSLTSCTPLHVKWFRLIFENVRNVLGFKLSNQSVLSVIKLIIEEFEYFHKIPQSSEEKRNLMHPQLTNAN